MVLSFRGAPYVLLFASLLDGREKTRWLAAR